MNSPNEPSITSMELPGWLTALQVVVSLFLTGLFGGLAVLPGMDPILAPAVLPMAIGYAVLVGSPVAAICDLKGWSGPLAAILAGAVALTPISLLTSAAGSILETAVILGIGALAGAGTWGLLKLQRLPGKVGPGRRHPRLAGLGGSFVLVTFALGLAAVVLRLMAGPTDNTCHNLFRDGRRTIGPVFIARLDTKPYADEALRPLLRTWSDKRAWSFRDWPQHVPDALVVTMCVEPGTQIEVSRYPYGPEVPADLHGVQVKAYQPQGGDTWKAPTRELIQVLRAQWPGRVHIEQAGGMVELENDPEIQGEPRPAPITPPKDHP